MGHKHDRQELLDAALAVAHDVGFSQLSFGRVAKQLGISDRTVVYYFPTKTDLVTQVLTTVSRQLEGRLSSIPSGSAADHRHLARLAWPGLAVDEADAVFALFFEANGLAAAGSAPYDALVPELVSGWVAWAEDRLVGTGTTRRAEAEAAVALIDGLLLFRQVAGADAADRAARLLLAE